MSSATCRASSSTKWGDRQIGDITRGDVVGVITTITDGGKRATARSVLALLRAMFGWAIERGLGGLEHSPCDHIKSDRLCGRQPSRDRVLTDAELRLIWFAAERFSGSSDAIVKTLMLTGLRLREAANVTDAGIEQREDGAWLCIGPARMKAERAHHFPICSTLAEIIAASPRRGRGLVFTMCSGRPVVGFSALKKEI